MRYNPGYTSVMKTAVSVPDRLFRAAEDLARRRRMSRSRLYAEAISRYLEAHRGEGVTEALNRVYGAETSAMDPLLVRMQAVALTRKKKW